MDTIRNTIINKINSGITKHGLYRTLNNNEIADVIKHDWVGNPNAVIYCKFNVYAMKYNDKYYAISIDNNQSYSAFYML